MPVQPSGEAIPDEDQGDEHAARRSYRAQRFSYLHTLRSASSLKSVRSCMNPIKGQDVVVTVGRSSIAHVGGVGRCGSPWSCPVCGPLVRRRRAQEVDEGIAAHLVRVGGTSERPAALFVTVTIPHRAGDSLGQLLDVLIGQYRAVQQSASYRRLARHWNLSGVIKSVEITSGPNGWHPHMHMVWLFDGPLGPGQTEEVRAWLSAAWAARVGESMGRSTHERHGVDVRPCYRNDQGETDGLGSYLVKLDGGWGAAFELVRSDLKRGRRGRYSPTELLRVAVEGGESWAWHKWWEYEQATKGRRMLTWSRGLRDRLGLGQEATDEEAAAALECDDGPDQLTFQVHHRRWRILLDQGKTSAYLERIERAAAIAYALCDLFGGRKPPDG